MPFDPTIAAIRFGDGLSPYAPPPGGVAAMLDLLSGPDLAAVIWPILPPDPTLAEFRAAARARREAAGTAAADGAEATYRAILARGRTTFEANMRAVLARGVDASDTLRERLVRFWADHFTVTNPGSALRHHVTPYVEQAIRPHVAGSFGDMLQAVILHPMMIDYLDQARSVGPDSPVGANGRGLNENLARELLELHTLGVGGPYGQADVRQLAELLTGLTINAEGEMDFMPRRAEPGAETVLGESYGPRPGLGPIRRVLDDLALHPATAAHVTGQMARHFMGDPVDPDLAAAMAARFLATDGDLLAVTAAMLEHPAAWVPEPRQVKPPTDFLISAMRALGVRGIWIAALDQTGLRRNVINPLAVMGQPWERAPGPNGWPEDGNDWVTSQNLAARIGWAFRMPRGMVGDLPDPRDFVHVALGPTPDAAATFAANAAESRVDGVGVVLASAAFQRR